MYQCINHKSHTFHFSTKSQARQFFLGWPRHHDIIVHFPGMQHRRRSLVHQHLRLQHGGVQALAALAASHHNQRPSEAYKKWHHRGCQGLPRFDSTTMTVFEKKNITKMAQNVCHRSYLNVRTSNGFQWCQKYIWIQFGILLTMSIFDSLNPSFLELKKQQQKTDARPKSVSFLSWARTRCHIKSCDFRCNHPSGVHASGGMYSYMNGWFVWLNGSDGIPTKPIYHLPP